MRTRLFSVDSKAPDPDAIKAAAGLLRRGGLVAFPTETVYGLGANLNDPQAMSELYTVKQRPFEKQATLHVESAEAIESFEVELPPVGRALTEKFWPGPLTVILRRPDGSTLGFRVPNHAVALALLREAQVPVVAPSANLSGQPPPRTAEAVQRDFLDKIDCILDGGPTPIGTASTVVDLSGSHPRVLRAGACAEDIAETIREFNGS